MTSSISLVASNQGSPLLIVRRCSSTGSPLAPTKISLSTPVALDSSLWLCLIPPPSMVITSISRPIQSGIDLQIAKLDILARDIAAYTLADRAVG